MTLRRKNGKLAVVSPRVRRRDKVARVQRTPPVRSAALAIWALVFSNVEVAGAQARGDSLVVHRRRERDAARRLGRFDRELVPLVRSVARFGGGTLLTAIAQASDELRPYSVAAIVNLVLLAHERGITDPTAIGMLARSECMAAVYGVLWARWLRTGGTDGELVKLMNVATTAARLDALGGLQLGRGNGQQKRVAIDVAALGVRASAAALAPEGFDEEPEDDGEDLDEHGKGGEHDEPAPPGTPRLGSCEDGGSPRVAPPARRRDP